MATGINESRLLAMVCRDSFFEFVKRFWGAVPGAGTLILNWHIELVCNELQAIAERVFKGEPKAFDWVLNISPGTSKSTLVSILFPAWVWTRMPTARVMTASHTEALVLDLANKSRDVVRHELYRAMFPEIVLAPAQDSKGYFRNTAGGDRYTCTVAGKSPMGFHGHFLIVDDPIDPKKVLSEVELLTAATFMTDVISTRKVDKEVTVTLLVMQRLGIGDPTEVMLEQAKVEGAAKVRHICLPGELLDDVKGGDGAELTGHGVIPGELAARYIDGLMDPRRLSKRVLAEFKAKGAHFYATQILQRPYAKSGGLFKFDWFYKNDPVKTAPFHAKRIRYWDRASSISAAACETAGTLIAHGPDGRYYVEHCRHGRWEPGERNRVMLAQAHADRNRYGEANEPIIWVEMEGGSSGRDAWLGIVRALAGFRVREHNVSREGDKWTRAEPWATQWEGGNAVLVNDGSWDVNAFVKQHVAFNGVSGLKDIVDSASGCFNRLANDLRPAGTLYIRQLKGRGNEDSRGRLRILLCTMDQFMTMVLNEPHVVITLNEPAVETEDGVLACNALSLQPNALRVKQLALTFADIDPEEINDRWREPYAPYNRTPDGLVLTKEDGKKLWFTLLHKGQGEPPRTIVLCSNGDRRAVSVAYALCDVLRLPRDSVEDMTGATASVLPTDAPNKHVFQVIKRAREMVV